MRPIDADALMCKVNDSFKSAGLHGEDFRKFKRWVNNAPTIDAVEVVRCKECTERDDDWCMYFGKMINPDDFCSYGERLE